MNSNSTIEKIMSLLVFGYSNVEIAKELGYSQHTIKFYVGRIIKALKAKNRIHAACIIKDLEYEEVLYKLYRINASELPVTCLLYTSPSPRD